MKRREKVPLPRGMRWLLEFTCDTGRVVPNRTAYLARIYCPQWCYIISPPPPPFEFPDDNSSGPKISPLVIAIIGILASAFLLVSYYTLISKYCGNNDPARRRDQSQGQNEEIEGDHHPSLHEPWHVATTGLDEVIIRSITVCRYKKGDAMLSMFLALIHGSALTRIAHCVVLTLFSLVLPCPQLPPPATETPQGNESWQNSQRSNDNVAVTQDTERVAGDEQVMQNPAGDPKTPLRVFSDLGNLEERDTIIEMRDIDGYQRIRRSVSMDHPCQSHASVADILRMNQDEVVLVEDCSGGVGSSKHSAEDRKSIFSNRRRVLDCVLNPVTMKRSLSSGRFFPTGHGRVHDATSPV
ncbi:RING-H2 FINGER PROTEIN ATL51-RELATED [Salix viminalis]|uniref:RING-type E3 ubiquitin transferase n=1 Tax=Salix viminalis TaxID=40686 RepID=A0A9Q0TNG3_SALVM|nr:RING-H2 FINGER PROTEIN ATL51-RELATED [Salix viminalis]